MQSEIRRLFEVVEKQRAAIQSRAGDLSDAQIHWVSNPAIWSVGRIVEHLVLSDETVGRAQDADKIQAEAIMFRVVPRPVRLALILRALNRDVALPLPSPAIEPHGNVPVSELLSRWEAARREMGRILETIRSDEKRYSHPVLGSLNAVQMLELEQAHTAYHTRQMEALQREPAFPQSLGNGI